MYTILYLNKSPNLSRYLDKLFTQIIYVNNKPIYFPQGLQI